MKTFITVITTAAIAFGIMVLAYEAPNQLQAGAIKSFEKLYSKN